MKTVLMFDRNTWIKQIGHREPLLASLRKNYNVIDVAKYNPKIDVEDYKKYLDTNNDFDNRPSISRLARKHYSRLSKDEFDRFSLQIEQEYDYLSCVLNERIKETDVDVIITEGNHQVAYYASQRIGMQYGIPVVGIENSFCGEKIYMDIRGGVGNEMREMVELWKHFSPYRVDNKAVDSMNGNKGQVPKSFRYRAKRNNNGLDYIHKHEHMKKFNRYLLVCGQVDCDSVICRDIDPIKNIDEFFEIILRATEDMDDVGIIVRIHPWDEVVTNNVSTKFFDSLSGRDRNRILIIKNKEFYTYNLFQCVESIVTLTSQIGLEAAIKGVPVVTVGKAFYNLGNFTLNSNISSNDDKKSFTKKVRDQIEESFIVDKISMQNKAQCFASFLFNEYMVSSKDSEKIKQKIEKAMEAKNV